MNERTAEKIAVSTGFVSVVLFLVGFLAPGIPPMADDPASEIKSFYVDKRTSILAGMVLIWLATALFLWFVGALRAHLRRYEAGEGRLSAVVLAGGIVAVAGVYLNTFIQAGLAYNVAADASPELVKALYDIGTVSVALGTPSAAVAMTATSLVVLRRGALPRWTAWFGFVAALVNLAGVTPIFSTTGLLSPTGPLGLIPFIASMLWVLVVAATMLPRVGSSN